ncbi:MAG TPA: chromate resistance protein ChrB domain-containing protein [Gemmatimonadaceae bacterium]|jgi:hypothetical protein|nr:chromate resistance protein ChrB domain-containing protein [Gemmatimonadaceae bacterium]
MTATPQGRWVLLIHQIPPKPDYLRVKISRRLQRIGAVAIKNSVYVLPASDSTIEDFQWVLREIVAEHGEGSVCHASFIEGLTDADVEALFRSARAADYDEIVVAARGALKALGANRAVDAERRAQARAELARLQRRLSDVTALDFFGAGSRSIAQEAVGLLEVRLRAAAAQDASPAVARETPATRVDPRDVRDRTWVTREGVFVDRMASAWLVQRFIDSGARFAFVADGYVPTAGELRFDMFEAEFTHEGDRCTFETLVRRFGLDTDAALRAVAEVVHDIDIKDAKFGRAEAAGVARLVEGIAAKYAADPDRLEHGSVLFDTLYESFRAAGGASRPRSPDTAIELARPASRSRRRGQ